jgi:lysozyme
MRDEGLRLRVYDDATGKPITKGDALTGHPTIGFGRALDVNGLSAEEATYLLDNDIKRVSMLTENAFPWFESLTPARKDVILSMVFNLGISTFIEFRGMILAIQSSDFERAAIEMRCSHWASQVGKRAEYLSRMMATGEYQE